MKKDKSLDNSKEELKTFIEQLDYLYPDLTFVSDLSYIVDEYFEHNDETRWKRKAEDDNKIHVGDEICVNRADIFAWVTYINNDSLECVTSEGKAKFFSKKDCKKTGRHSETLAKLFDELKSMNSMNDEYGDYRDITDEEAKDILEWFIHTEFFDKRDTKEGKAIIRGILALNNLIQNDRQKKIITS